jgi:DNA-binding FadR family transcriptional regulator
MPESGIAAKREGVKSVDEKFILDLFELRLTTASTAAAFAELSRSRPHLDRMNRARIVADEGTLANERGQQADIDFHESILQAANNELLYLLSSTIGAAITWSTLTNRELSPLGTTRPVSRAGYSTRLPRVINTYRPNLGVP